MALDPSNSSNLEQLALKGLMLETEQDRERHTDGRDRKHYHPELAVVNKTFTEFDTLCVLSTPASTHHPRLFADRRTAPVCTRSWVDPKIGRDCRARDVCILAIIQDSMVELLDRDNTHITVMPFRRRTPVSIRQTLQTILWSHTVAV